MQRRFWRMVSIALAIAIAFAVSSLVIDKKPLPAPGQGPGVVNPTRFCDAVPIDLQHTCLKKVTHSVMNAAQLLSANVMAQLKAKLPPKRFAQIRHYAQLMSHDDMAKGIWFDTEFLWKGPIPYGVRYKVVIQPGTTAQEADWIRANGGNLQAGLILLIGAACGLANPVFGAVCAIVAAFEYRALSLIIVDAANHRRCYNINVDTALAGPLAVIGWHVQEYGQGSRYISVLRFINGQWDWVKVWVYTTDHCKTHDLPPTCDHPVPGQPCLAAVTKATA